MTQKEKIAKENLQNKTIPKNILNSFLQSENTTIPTELHDYIATVPKENVVIDIYRITRCEIPNNETEVIVFTQTRQQRTEQIPLFDGKRNITVTGIIEGNKHYVNNDLLDKLKTKYLNDIPELRFIASKRQVPVKRNCYIDLDTREIINATLLMPVKEGTEKKSNSFYNNETHLLADANIESGLIIKKTEGNSALLKFNSFDKSDIKFKDLLTDIKPEQLNTVIKHLQKVIPNDNDLIFIANQVCWHYYNPFNTQHRRTNLVFHGGQGTGKTTVIEIICDLFNSSMNNYSYNKNDVFNAELKGQAVVVFNEYKKKGDSADLIKRYFESENYYYNDKNIRKMKYPVFAISICSLNPDNKFNKIENLVETQDNRNYLIEMIKYENLKETFDYLREKKNYSILQTALILIALKYRKTISEMESITRNKTQLMNLEKMNFSEIWQLIVDTTQEHNLVAIPTANKFFDNYFTHNKEQLIKQDENINTIFRIELTKQINKNSAVKMIIKEQEGILKAIPTTDINKTGKVRNCYIISKEHTDKISTDFDLNENFDNTKINIQPADFIPLKNKLNEYLNSRKNNFKNVNDND